MNPDQPYTRVRRDEVRRGICFEGERARLREHGGYGVLSRRIDDPQCHETTERLEKNDLLAVRRRCERVVAVDTAADRIFEHGANSDALARPARPNR